MRYLSVFAPCAALALLAGCGGNKGDDDERTATGKVLEGTISDSMLPLDTVRSQPPLAKETGTPGSGTASPGADDAEPVDDAEPAPADAPEGGGTEATAGDDGA